MSGSKGAEESGEEGRGGKVKGGQRRCRGRRNDGERGWWVEGRGRTVAVRIEVRVKRIEGRGMERGSNEVGCAD